MSEGLNVENSQILKYLDAILDEMVALLPKPKQVNFSESFVWRFSEKTVHQAIVQKLARQISGLRAATLLHENGLFQEQASLQRMLDEIGTDIAFLSLGATDDKLDDLHNEYLGYFYQEEFDRPDDTLGSRQNRPSVSRKKVNAWLARRKEFPIDPHNGSSVLNTIYKAYSGYLHAASPHVMEMYSGSRFETGNLSGTRNHASHARDLKMYVYRGVINVGVATKAFGDEALVDKLYSLLCILDDEIGLEAMNKRLDQFKRIKRAKK